MSLRALLPGVLLCAAHAFAADNQIKSADALKIASLVDPIIEKEIAAGVPGAAFVFVREGSVVYSQGYGVADLRTKAKVDPERTVWPIASITKVVTAMGALQLVADRRVRLDDDLNRYLERVQVPSQGYGPLTLRHVLSHTGALDEIPGRRYDGKEAPDTAAFLRNKLVRYREPGKLTAYSTYGIALAGVLIEDVSGQRYPDYFAKHIFAPAEMSSARFMMRQGDEKGVATPYEIEDGRATAIPYEWYATPLTSSMVATAADMGRLLRFHNLGNPGILPWEFLRAMHIQAATNHPAVPGWSFGFQLDQVNGVSIAEHGGDIGGFSALFALLPDKREGFFIVNHGESSELRFRVKQALLDALYPAKPASVPAADPKNVPALAEYAGRYISSIACRTCPLSDDQIFVVKVQPNGTLSLWGQTWVPRQRDLFVREDGKRLLGFARDDKSKIVSVTGGSWRVADRL